MSKPTKKQIEEILDLFVKPSGGSYNKNYSVGNIEPINYGRGNDDYQSDIYQYYSEIGIPVELFKDKNLTEEEAHEIYEVLIEARDKLEHIYDNLGHKGDDFITDDKFKGGLFGNIPFNILKKLFELFSKHPVTSGKGCSCELVGKGEDRRPFNLASDLNNPRVDKVDDLEKELNSLTKKFKNNYIK